MSSSARETPASEEDAADSLRRVARGSALSGVGAVIAAVGGVWLTLTVTRAYEPDLAGTFFACTALFVIISSLAQLGTDVGLVRFVSAQSATGQNYRLLQTLQVALLPVVALSVVLAGAMWLSAPTLAGWLGNDKVSADMVDLLRALAPFLPLASVYGSMLAATRGRGSMRYTVLVDSVFRTVAQPVLLLVTVFAGGSTTAGGVAWALPYPLGVGVCVVVLVRQLRRMRRQDGPTTPGGGAAHARRAPLFGEFWRFTAPRAAAGAVVMTWRRFDVLLVAALSGPADAAIYTAATRFLVVGSLGIQAIQMTVSPQLARLFARGDSEGSRRVYATSTLWTMVFSWPLYVVTAAAVGLVIPIFGSGYEAGASSVVVLSSAMLLATACGGVDAVLLMSGRTLLSLANAVATLVVNVGLDLLLIPRWGILGAAVGWAVSIALRNLLGLAQIHHLMSMWPFTRRAVQVALASLVCFAVVPGTLTAIDAPQVWLVVSLAIGALAYAYWTWSRRTLLELDTFGGALTRRGRRGTTN